MLSLIINNMYNAYAGGFSLLNSIPQLGRIGSTLSFCAAALALSCFPEVVSEAKQYITWIGHLMGPIVGVCVADLFLVKKKIINPELLTGKYSYNKKAIMTIIKVTILSTFILDQWSPGFLSFIAAGLTYSLWVNLIKHKSSEAKGASA
jgi:purine-cytosine permease-like protein